jgi:hypothetical protein
MAIVFLEGFENYGPIGTSGSTLATAMQARWPVAAAQIGATSYGEIVAGRNGGKALYFPTTEAIYEFNLFNFDFQANVNVVFGFAYKPSPQNFNASGHPFFQTYLNFGSSAGELLRLEVSGGGHAILIRSSTYLGSHPVFSGGWHYYEYKIYFDDAAGTLEGRIDGNVVLTLSGIDTRAVSASCNSISFVAQLGNVVDDIYVATGAGQDYLGPITIEAIRPNADVTTNWSSTGGTHYGEIDENLFDANTYISSDSANTEDQWTCANLATVTDDIVAIQPSVIGLVDAGATRILTVTCESGANKTDASMPIASTSGREVKLISETDPNTANAWTSTAVEAAKYGVKVGD